MNILTALLRVLFILALFANCCLSEAQNETSSDHLKSPSQLISNLIDESDNTIESATLDETNNSTSNDLQSDQADQLLLASIKDRSSSLIDVFNEVDVPENFTVPCNETSEYRCKSNGKCISKILVCDGIKDCPSLGDDEADCDHNCTRWNKFECKSDGKCISTLLKCNGFKECNDGSDEEDCAELPIPTQCFPDEFECSTGVCINKNKVCDHHNDCDDGSDELFCKYTCAEDEFQCKSDLKCIPKVLECNGKKECLDGSDEQGCFQSTANYTCPQNEYSCQMDPKKCIPLEYVCDGEDNCGNGLDERGCEDDLCKDHHCAHECKQERNIAKCVCQTGFKLSANGVDCEDINECLEIPSFCSGHECINLNGSATCKCATGFRFNEAEKRCKVINGRNATIVYSNLNELRNTSLSIKSYLATQLQNANEPSINGVIRQNLHAIGMFVYDFQDNYLIWHDMNERRFYIAALDENKRPIERNEFWTKYDLPQPHHYRMPRTLLKRNQHYVLMENITNVEGLAIDHLHDLIYWSDSDRNVIEVAQVRDSTKRKVLVDTDLDEPKGIAVNVEEGFVLWTDWGSKRIEYMRTDGTGRRTIVEKDLEWPYSITLDPQLNKIYFVDTKKNTLNVVDLDGQNHKVLLTNPMYLDRANDLDVFEDKIYFCDQESESILSVDKFDPQSTLRVLVKDLKNVLSCKVVHFSKQLTKSTNLCAQSDCEFLCLPRNDIKSHVCACSSNSVLNSDKRTCQTNNSTTKIIIKKDVHPGLWATILKNDANVIYILALAAFIILVATGICGLLIYNYTIKRANKLKFNNAQYQKTPQQDVKVPSCMEPLNPTSNQFV